MTTDPWAAALARLTTWPDAAPENRDPFNDIDGEDQQSLARGDYTGPIEARQEADRAAARLFWGQS